MKSRQPITERGSCVGQTNYERSVHEAVTEELLRAAHDERSEKQRAADALEHADLHVHLGQAVSAGWKEFRGDPVLSRNEMYGAHAQVAAIGTRSLGPVDFFARAFSPGVISALHTLWTTMASSQESRGLLGSDVPNATANDVLDAVLCPFVEERQGVASLEQLPTRFKRGAKGGKGLLSYRYQVSIHGVLSKSAGRPYSQSALRDMLCTFARHVSAHRARTGNFRAHGGV